MQSNNDENPLQSDPVFKATCEGKRWLMTIDTGIRLIGRVTDFNAIDKSFTLNPAYEYIVQVQLRQGMTPNRQEVVSAVDLVDGVPVHIRPRMFLWIDALPEWRQAEIHRLIDQGEKDARAFCAQKRSGLVIAGT